MAIQFQYTRLDYQETAVQSIADVLSDVPFSPALRSEANPVFDTIANAETLKSNINEIRSRNDVKAGEVKVDASFNLDVLMETGTGKTFTFIETIFKLHKDKCLAKFIILVLSMLV